MTAEKRRIRVNAANLASLPSPFGGEGLGVRVTVTGLRDFFPADAVGGPRRKSANGNGHGFELILDGLDKTVVTDIGSGALPQAWKAGGW